MRGRRLGGLVGGALVLGVALAPGPSQDPAEVPGAAQAGADRPVLARAEAARLYAEAGNRAVELAWVYYSENRINADTFYRWSHRAWEAGRDAATDRAGRASAADRHLERMLQLEAKIGRIRQLGFGNSLDVAEVVYYVREADLIRAEAHAEGR